MKSRHEKLAQSIKAEHLQDIMKYILGKILQGYPSNPNDIPGIHFRVFYQISHPSTANLIIKTLNEFKAQTTTANIASSVIPACYLQNFSTFISICAVRHE